MADISFACPNCSQVLEAPEDMTGQVVECPACQQQITVPAPAATGSEEAGEEAGQTPAEEAGETPAEEAGETPDEEAAPASAKCPICDAKMEPDAVLCISCGYHTKLGKKIDTSLG